MLRSANEMIGYGLAAKDGFIGKVKDFLFDQPQWTVRWMVADTGRWLPGRKVLISPVSLGEANHISQQYEIQLTKDEIQSAPALDSDAPVSRQYEARWFNHYGWPYYWAGPGVPVPGVAPGVWAGGPYPGKMPGQMPKEQPPSETPETAGAVLRSVKEVTGYHIQAKDGDIGHVEDFIVDDESWTFRYMVVDTRNWLPGRKVLVAPDWMDSISWAERTVAVGLSRGEVKSSPQYDPAVPVNREYELTLYDYYGRPTYWR